MKRSCAGFFPCTDRKERRCFEKKGSGLEHESLSAFPYSTACLSSRPQPSRRPPCPRPAAAALKRWMQPHPLHLHVISLVRPHLDLLPPGLDGRLGRSVPWVTARQKAASQPHEASGNARQRRCLRRDGSGHTRQRQRLSNTKGGISQPAGEHVPVHNLALQTAREGGVFRARKPAKHTQHTHAHGGTPWSQVAVLHAVSEKTAKGSYSAADGGGPLCSWRPGA